MAKPPVNILTIDVEDWFQVENYATAISRSRWDHCELRVADNVQRLLNLLAEARTSATFFVLGWVAERLPELVRGIAAEGHEVASHGWSHTPIWSLEPRAFAAEVRASRALLEDLSGKPVLGYRAPTFSVTPDTLWALGELAAAGYVYDSSIFPVRHFRYGIPNAPTAIHRRKEGLWEIPLSVLRLGSTNLPVAGGGYLRLYPTWLTRRAIRQINTAGRPVVVYVHPWEFDPDQPWVAGVSPLRTFRHRVGLADNLRKLGGLLREFPFSTAAAALPH